MISKKQFQLFRVLAFITMILQMPFISMSQIYHPLVVENKVWSTFHEYSKDRSDPFSDYLKFEGDININDTVYKQIWVSEDTTGNNWTATNLIREDAQKRVWMRNASWTNEYLSYDFGAMPGDSLWLSIGNAYFLDSIDSVLLLNGEYRKAFHLTNSFCGQETWIEGIGCLRGVTMGGMCGAVGDNPALICMIQSDEVIYHNTSYPECHLVTGIDQREPAAGSIRVFPNPASDNITVSLPLFHSGCILILSDILQRSVISVPLTGSQNSIRIDLSGLPAGLFLLRYNNETLKIVIR